VALTFDRRSPYVALERGAEPYFPDTPPSCPICEKDYPNINSCAQACPVLANFSMIIFNPSAFIDVIKCSCTDTFQAAYPQCVDCFIKTDQEDLLNSKDLPSVVEGMRRICAMESVLLGNVSGANGYFTSTTSSTLVPTASSMPISGAVPLNHHDGGLSFWSIGSVLSLSMMMTMGLGL